jgi:hypothetical protein
LRGVGADAIDEEILEFGEPVPLPADPGAAQRARRRCPGFPRLVSLARVFTAAVASVEHARRDAHGAVVQRLGRALDS